MQAQVLGYETRNVSNDWLKPVSLGTRGPEAFKPLEEQKFLSPTYGPGQSSPKELAALRTQRMIQTLGRTAIFSNSPYVDNAFETLAAVVGSPQSSGGSLRRSGKLPRKGAKAAAINRAKRLVSQSAPFKPEVPFPDAVRVCNLQHDKSAMPALLKAYVFSKPKLPESKLEGYAEVLGVQPPGIQLQAVALLLQQGYYFTAVKIVYADHELLRATLEEMSLIVSQGLEEDIDVAARMWNWKEADKELFIKQFKQLKIINYYMDIRKQLRALKSHGAVALARVEREMLMKVSLHLDMQPCNGNACTVAHACHRKCILLTHQCCILCSIRQLGGNTSKRCNAYMPPCHVQVISDFMQQIEEDLAAADAAFGADDPSGGRHGKSEAEVRAETLRQRKREMRARAEEERLRKAQEGV